jgi:uncharacterized protein YbjT (DUF2867 family)
MKIILLGANGRTGREILSRALDAGDSVTALIRTEDRLADVTHPRLKVHVGSVCDSNVLKAIIPGIDFRSAERALPDGSNSISRAAVARFLLTEAKQSSYVNKVVGLCGYKDA